MKPEFRADILDYRTCCSLIEIGRFRHEYKQATWDGVLWESEWKNHKSPYECWFGVTNSKTQKATEKALKKMGFKTKTKWLNDDGQTLRLWVYVHKPKKRRKK